MTPFAPVRLSLAVAAAWGLAALTWLAAGPLLPGGRWLAVHLFTLGVVTNLVADLTRHFAATLLHVREPARGLPRIAVRNLGVMAVLAGRVNGVAALLGLGATVVAGEVLLGWRDIRSMRRRALPARHEPVARAYQRAHGAFLHAALLGALLGTGVLPGRWYGNVRLAHLHVAVLGWAGVPVLATLVFLGPTLLRVRASEAADRHARRLLPWASWGVTFAAVSLLLGFPLIAAAGVAAFAVVATVLVRDVLVVAPRAAAPNPALVVALCWLVAAAFADAFVLALGRTAYLDVVGVMALGGGVAPVVLASAGYLWAMSGGADALGRAARLRAVARWSTFRTVLWNAGCVALAAGGAGVPSAVSRAGAYAVVASGMLALVPLAARN